MRRLLLARRSAYTNNLQMQGFKFGAQGKTQKKSIKQNKTKNPNKVILLPLKNL